MLYNPSPNFNSHMKIKEIIAHLESIAPLSFQEPYDNSGLLIGNPENEVNSALLTLDVTPEVLNEAKDKNTGLIISHHPLIFQGLKKLTGSTVIEKTVVRSIKEDIAIYASHTNMDSALQGVNSRICEKLELQNVSILRPIKGQLCKLVTFVPEKYLDVVRQEIFEAGAGTIGNYDQCSFNTEGIGSFRGGENTNPFLGERGELHFETEIRIETIFPKYLKNRVIEALIKSHPYEEVAYDIYPLENEYKQAGMGMTGELKKDWDEKLLLDYIKKRLNVKIIRHTHWINRPIRKVAVCGGAGSFLLHDAVHHKTDIFISGDFKYHEFFKAEGKLLIADIGHYESEHHVKEIFSDLLKEKFPNFAVQISEVNTNPVNFY